MITKISKIRRNSEIENKNLSLVAPSSKNLAILLSGKIQVNILLISAHELLE